MKAIQFETRQTLAAQAYPRLTAMLLARVLAAWVALLWLLTPSPSLAAQVSAEASIQTPAEWVAWRETFNALRYTDPQGALGQMRSLYENARLRADRHSEWLNLALLARDAAVLDHGASEPLLMLAEQALVAAQRAGDKAAIFELLVAIESTRVGQRQQAVREGNLAQAAALAAELGDSARAGLVEQLRGMAAAQVGQTGEALVHYRNAQALFTSPFDRASLLMVMAQAQGESPAEDAAQQALARLAQLDTTLPPHQYPVFVQALVLRSALVSRASPTEAVSLAQRAASIARQSGLATPQAQAQIALGQAYLATGNPAQAVASFSATALDALNPAERLSGLAGWALALARQGDAAAPAVLARGQRFAEAELAPESAAVMRFLEASSEVRKELGDAAGAITDLAKATAMRSAVANAAREGLVQARMDAAQGAVQAQAEADWRMALNVAVTLLAAAVVVLGALTARQFHRRRALYATSSRLQADNARLEQANATRSQQLANACHDLRQPAHVLGLLTESTLPEPGQPASEADEHIHAVRRCSRTLTDMLDTLIGLSQLEQGNTAPTLEAVDLGELLIELDLHYRRAALDKGLTWQVGTSSAVVLSDRRLLRRMLFNLASNAVRCSAHGGVHLLAVTLGERVYVEVADTGPGLPAEGLLAATEEGEPGAGDGGTLGLGVGLTMVRRACRLLGHEFSVPLSSPRGSVVRIGMATLPVTPGQSHTQSHKAATKPEAPSFAQQAAPITEARLS